MGGVSSKWKKIRKHVSKADVGASNVTSPPPRSFSLFDLIKPQQPSGLEAKSENGVVQATNGTIEIFSRDITTQIADVIVISSTSGNLRDYVLEEAGDSIRQMYDSARKYQPDKSICTDGGYLPCERIYFIPCPELLSTPDKSMFRNFVKEAIRLAADEHSKKIRSLAIPAIGCGLSGCDPNFVAKTLISAVAYELKHQPSLRFNVYFVIRQSEQNTFDAFRTELANFENKEARTRNSSHDVLNPSVEKPASRHKENEYKIEKRLLDQSSNDYEIVMKIFKSTMKSSQYSKIIRIELVWNECAYKQYMIHKEAFSQRLQKDTEKLLFHGCSENSANGIIQNCFNRSWAGVHGTAYGQGTYFSSRACYSHSYATPNTQGERCMFLAKVLVGNSILGNSSMKVCPPGYDTTTDGSHIYVIYHDAQAFGNYLITYK